MEHNSNVPLVQVNTNNIIQNESLDCGIKALGWCSGVKCQNKATIRNFIIVFAIVGALQGAVQTYFRISTQQAGIDLGFDIYVLDWLLATMGLAQGIFILGLIFYSQRFHPMSWISGFILLEAAFCIITIIPTLNFLPNLQEGRRTIYAPPLCDTYSNQTDTEKIHSLSTLILLFVLQSIISLTGGVLYCIGYSYMDDNSKVKDVAILMSITLAAHIWGAQLGSAVSLQVEAVPLGWWLGWVILVPLLLVSAIIIGLFPRKLLKTVVRQAANLIIQRISQPNLVECTEYVKEFTFFPSMKRLFTNKILIFNLLAFTFLETAIFNYFMQEESYMQSRFYMATSEANGLLDEWTSRFLLILLKPPIVGLAILITGFIIAKLSPRGKGLATWNLVVEILVGLLFIGYIFLHCNSEKLAHTYKNKVEHPHCASHCLCGNNVLFTPVCPDKGKRTYFSPCHAGCRFSESINHNIMIYKNCSCGPDPSIAVFNGLATPGACNNDECQAFWLIYQILTLFGSILLGTCKVSRLLIILRSVLPQDKTLSLALQLTFAGLIVNIPGKLSYDYIASSTCEYWSTDSKKCLLHQSPLHGDILNIVSAILIAIAIIFDILVIVFIKDLDCFSKKGSADNAVSPIQLQTMNSPDEPDNNPNPNTQISNENIIDSQPQNSSYLRNYQESSPDSSLLQNSPRRIGGRRSRNLDSPRNSVNNSELREEETVNENLRPPSQPSPQVKELNYAQVMFEFKKKRASLPKQTSPTADATAVGSDLDENLDFRLQQEQLPNKHDIDADDELSELDTNRKNDKHKAKETSF